MRHINPHLMYLEVTRPRTIKVLPTTDLLVGRPWWSGTPHRRVTKRWRRWRRRGWQNDRTLPWVKTWRQRDRGSRPSMCRVDSRRSTPWMPCTDHTAVRTTRWQNNYETFVKLMSISLPNTDRFSTFLLAHPADKLQQQAVIKNSTKSYVTHRYIILE